MSRRSLISREDRNPSPSRICARERLDARRVTVRAARARGGWRGVRRSPWRVVFAASRCQGAPCGYRAPYSIAFIRQLIDLCAREGCATGLSSSYSRARCELLSPRQPDLPVRKRSYSGTQRNSFARGTLLLRYSGRESSDRGRHPVPPRAAGEGAWAAEGSFFSHASPRCGLPIKAVGPGVRPIESAVRRA